MEEWKRWGGQAVVIAVGSFHWEGIESLSRSMQRQMAVLTKGVLESKVEILKKRAWHAQRSSFFLIQRKTVLLALCTITKMLVFPAF